MLETIWFVLWGVLWAAYFILDGFDLGVGYLMPFLSKDEKDRLVSHNAIGPFWDGNEVWLISAGGITFAAFPATYAIMFSALYSPLMLILFALILRGAAVGLRPEVDSMKAKRAWDWVFSGSSLAVALLFGVAFANLFRGIPIDKAGEFQGNLLTVLNPYGLLGGALFVVMLGLHGTIWMALKAEGDLEARAKKLARPLWGALLVCAAVFLGASAVFTELWDQYLAHPALFIIPVLAVGSLAAVLATMLKDKWLWAWIASAVFIASAVAFGLAGMFPAMLISSLDRAFDVTAFDAASGPYTLKIMLGVALVFVPIVIGYQIWVYRLFKGKAPGGEYGH